MAATAKPEPCVIVIFGASGDLTRRKLVPSLYDTWMSGLLPEGCAVLGVSRTEMADEVFREHLRESLREFTRQYDEDRWNTFAQRLYYLSADSTRYEAFEAIKARIHEVAGRHHGGENVLFYLSMAPQLFDSTIANLGASGLITEGKRWCSINRDHMPWQRIIVEKPFGHDPASAAHLNRVLGRVFEEESIYRIDHYLGKDTVQNLLVFRFANAIFEPIWNRNYIDHVQVSALETVGVEGRGGYYDSPSGGAMRDMIQSHLLQVMAMTAMEPPNAMRAQDIRTESMKVLAAARALGAGEIDASAVRGQYGAGRLDGRAMPGYREEHSVARDSQTDTYAALQVFVDTWRWQGVPFYLRSGKRMARKTTEIVISFRPTPHCLFRERALGGAGMAPNQIVINVQPNEGIRLRFEGKIPGAGMNIKSVVMDFDYVEQFKAKPREAYATLLLDAMRGDQTLFKHREEIEHAWRIVQPVLDHWKEHPQHDLPNYDAGTWGPTAADAMLARDGRHWHNG